ncbi:class I SAM-dependent methyltransferase [Rivularia sp. UHCC 0363]|uniref:class I SAM-dependent methyltransferase n=1 Tax=Rivularia sp. UHCC 0363 TaxID=3110244 RepID=UPI002B2067DF|nr:class I SAM-dependent methyltransferase [Rivularia sp. UHCC 0363]MEA5596091.1 class I SAM-dependent methyltransferase [Rivularia sp. UHCC 0363]
MRTDYNANWDKYWSNIHDSSEVLWNVPYLSGVKLDYERFQPFLKDSHLPLIDFGCGDGTQTQFFTQHFNQVIGLEISKTAVELARKQAQDAGLLITYEVLDNLEKIQEIHKRFGDANIYVRGVLHQIEPQQRSTVAEQLKVLLGDKGILYIVELSSQAHNLLQQKIQNQEIPLGLAKVLESNIKPGAVSLENLQSLFPSSDFSFLESGETFIATNAKSNDKIMQLPAQYSIICSVQHS